jgi:hypothetical protein
VKYVKKKTKFLSVGVRITMIRCVVYLRIFKMFHELMNNPVLCAVLQESVAKNGINGTESCITSATEKNSEIIWKSVHIMLHTVNGCVLG